MAACPGARGHGAVRPGAAVLTRLRRAPLPAPRRPDTASPRASPRPWRAHPRRGHGALALARYRPGAPMAHGASVPGLGGPCGALALPWPRPILAAACPPRAARRPVRALDLGPRPRHLAPPLRGLPRPWRGPASARRARPRPPGALAAARPLPLHDMAPAQRGPGPAQLRLARPRCPCVARHVRSSAPTCARLVRDASARPCAPCLRGARGALARLAVPPAHSSTPRRARLPPPPPCILCVLITLFISLNGNLI
jgi:hypothetical protein